jgi:hypothetical protein
MRRSACYRAPARLDRQEITGVTIGRTMTRPWRSLRHPAAVAPSGRGFAGSGPRPRGRRTSAASYSSARRTRAISASPISPCPSSRSWARATASPRSRRARQSPPPPAVDTLDHDRGRQSLAVRVVRLPARRLLGHDRSGAAAGGDRGDAPARAGHGWDDEADRRPSVDGRLGVRLNADTTPGLATRSQSGVQNGSQRALSTGET